jgi:hypothetical protein
VTGGDLLGVIRALFFMALGALSVIAFLLWRASEAVR